jgi:hypothetical protein
MRKACGLGQNEPPSTRLAGFDDQAGTAFARESTFGMDALPEVVEVIGWARNGHSARGLLPWPGRLAVPFASPPFAAPDTGYPAGVL